MLVMEIVCGLKVVCKNGCICVVDVVIELFFGFFMDL